MTEVSNRAHSFSRRTVAASMAAILIGLSGCTTLPGSSSPQVVRGFDAPAVDIDIPRPRRDVAPDLILRDFYSALAHPTDNYAAAREFLTTEANKQWRPDPVARILDGINIISGAPPSEGNLATASQSFSIRGNLVGVFGANGAFEPSGDAYESEMVLERGNDGQWRIDKLSNVVLIERQEFLDNNAPRNLYFIDPSGNQLVADRRWIYRGVDDAAKELLDKLRMGPRSRYAPGVTSVLPPSARIEVVEGDDGPGQVVSISGLGDVDDTLRTLLAAQIVWTLSSADVRGPWTMMADDQPLLNSHVAPWTRDSDELRLYDPTVSPADRAPLRTVDTTGIQEIVNGQAQPIGNEWASTGSNFFTSAGIGVDVNGNEIIAAVARSDQEGEGRSTLLLGLPDDKPAPVLTGKSLTRPSWSPDASAVWTAVDGTKVVRLVQSESASRPVAEEIDTAGIQGILGSQGQGISELRVDPSGTQVAMIVDGKIYTATIERSDSSPWKLVHPRLLPLVEGATPVTLAWTPNSSITVGAFDTETPMWRLYPDGATTSVLPRLNLSPPVTVVTASSSKLYALDSNALMELIASEGEEQFWRAVPGGVGRMAPVSVE
ncbi:LpqB family beta-propeller domain-containing protein [Corynebacterium sp. H78]|uniref:LpqB family beta-propeller domain-containing protein n=1 Tax=Corynebacterium sp. H78 TaxID=3133417 RepID=UPI0030B3419F